MSTSSQTISEIAGKKHDLGHMCKDSKTFLQSERAKMTFELKSGAKYFFVICKKNSRTKTFALMKQIWLLWQADVFFEVSDEIFLEGPLMRWAYI
jgi:hypothetical protein